MLTFTRGIQKGVDGHRYLRIYARVSGRRIGYVEGIWDEPEAFISFFGVDEVVRGRGIGTALLKRFLHAACRAKKTAVALEVRSDNTASLYACRRAGFTRVPHRGRFRRFAFACPVGASQALPG